MTEVYSVTGEVDLIAMVRVREHEQLADVIADRLSKVDGIVRTQTYIAFRAYSSRRPRRRRSPSAWRTDGRSGSGRLRPSLSAARARPIGRARGRAAVVDRRCGVRQPGPEPLDERPGRRPRQRAVGDERRRGVEQHRLAHRPALPGEHAADDVGVRRRAPRRAGRRP